MASFFIRRPIVAIVIAILTVIVGAIAIALLPIAQFPNIAPPEIWLQANYPGADAKTLEQAVATPIEQQVTGVDNMEYMYSVNATNGSQTSLLVDFDLKTDPNMDLIPTQSCVSNWQTVSFLPSGDQLWDHVAKVGHRSFPAAGFVDTRPTAPATRRFCLTTHSSISTIPSAGPMAWAGRRSSGPASMQCGSG